MEEDRTGMSFQINDKLQDLIRYARRVKNTRLVLLARETPAEDFLKFLRNRHRYREIAVVERDKYNGKCFRFYEPELSLELPISEPVLKKAITASILLLSPLLLLQKEEELEKLSVWKRAGKWKDLWELLRHIRIAEYAMIDAAGMDTMTETFASTDGKKRFWRVKEGGQTPAVEYLIAGGFLSVVLYYIN